MCRSTQLAAVVAGMLAIAVAAGAQDWPRIDRPAAGVTLVYDDYGDWGGGSMGASHQSRPDYRVRKRLDLSAVPQTVFDRAQRAELLVYFACPETAG